MSEAELVNDTYKTLVQYRSGPVQAPQGELSEKGQWLYDQGLIEPCAFMNLEQDGITVIGIPTAYQITVAGENALAKFEEEHDRQAKAERQQRFQNKMSVAQVLIPLITFILGLIVEHYAGLVSALAEVLGRWVK